MEAQKKRLWRILQNIGLSLAFLGLAIVVCAWLSRASVNGSFAVPVFILAVALTAWRTDGYVYGVLVSLAGVFCTNYWFTRPFHAFNFSISGYPLTFASMLVVSILISTLTTQTRRQEQMRYEAEAENLRANLLRSLSHDLRTPLTTILGAADTLLESPDMAQSDRQELVEAIDKDARWLIRMTENLLSVTKCGTGVALKTEDEVVEEIVSGAVVKFKRAYPQMPIAVHRPQNIMLARMDALLIEQVLMNLFENAAVHGETTTRIDVDITADEPWVRICVRDDGVGFPPAMLKNPFGGYRAHEQQAGRRNMGIGLSACRAILRAHGGDISAANGPNGGAEVAFWLPGEEADHG